MAKRGSDLLLFLDGKHNLEKIELQQAWGSLRLSCAKLHVRAACV
jgi:hypothetical protein